MIVDFVKDQFLIDFRTAAQEADWPITGHVGFISVFEYWRYLTELPVIGINPFVYARSKDERQGFRDGVTTFFQ